MNTAENNIHSWVINTCQLTKLLTLEHLRDPTTLLWTALAPCLMFTLTTQAKLSPPPVYDDYISAAAWFYSYISASVAFFGFSFYLIGRRESGFNRSFLYQPNAIGLFLTSHTLCYSLISLGYSAFFYIITKPLYGSYSPPELFHLLICFYVSYLGFTVIGLFIAALPIRFSTASTIFSLLSFLMLLSGYLGGVHESAAPSWITLLNPLAISRQVILGRSSLLASFSLVLLLLLPALYLTARYFRIQPVWSRY